MRAHLGAHALARVRDLEDHGRSGLQTMLRHRGREAGLVERLAAHAEADRPFTVADRFARVVHQLRDQLVDLLRGHGDLGQTGLDLDHVGRSVCELDAAFEEPLGGLRGKHEMAAAGEAEHAAAERRRALRRLFDGRERLQLVVRSAANGTVVHRALASRSHPRAAAAAACAGVGWPSPPVSPLPRARTASASATAASSRRTRSVSA